MRSALKLVTRTTSPRTLVRRVYTSQFPRSIPLTSVEHGVPFWREQADSVHWFTPPSEILDSSQAPTYRWYPDGMTNLCYNALDRHIEEGRGNKTAFLYDNAYNGNQQSFTYKELFDQVNKAAHMLKSQGVTQGARVLLYMPLVPEAAIAMLACTRIGAVHSVVFAGFAPAEIAKRLDHADADFVITSSCVLLPGKRVLELKPAVDAAIELSTHKPKAVIVHQREPVQATMVAGRDVDWDEQMAKQPDIAISCAVLPSSHPCYVLYTSGTTGNPKGLVRETGSYVVALQYSLDHIFNVTDDSVMFTASDIGWVVGHSYIVYGPLIRGLTTIMFDGKPIGTPDAGTFWRVVEQYSATHLFAAPTAARAIKKEDPELQFLDKYDISSLELVSLAGERCDPNTLTWLRDGVKAKTAPGKAPFILDQYWQTESGWPMVASPRNLLQLKTDAEVPLGSAGKPVPGWKFVCLDDNMELVETPVRDGEQAYNLAFELPQPPGCSYSLYGDGRDFNEVYFCHNKKYYKTGDAGYIDKNGFVHILTRVDDVINVAGHRLCTASMEEIVAAHPDVAEGAVFGVKDELKGHVPVVCVVLKAAAKDRKANIPKEVLSIIDKQLGKIACANTCFVVDALPKTRSGKILRKELAAIAEGREFKVPPTIEDESVLGALKEVMGPQ